MPLEAKLATKSFQFHVHPHYKAKSKNVNCLCSYLQVPQITKSLESFHILPQQYRTKEVSKTLIMQLSFFGVKNRLRHVLRYKCINFCTSIAVQRPPQSLQCLTNHHYLYLMQATFELQSFFASNITFLTNVLNY